CLRRSVDVSGCWQQMTGGRTPPPLGPGFANDAPSAVVKGLTGSGRLGNDALPPALALPHQGPMMAVRVVAGPPGDRRRCPGATTPPLVGVVAAGTKAPEPLGGM